MKHHILAAASVAATIFLSACSSEPEVVDPTGPDPQAEALKNAPPVTELPPAIQRSRTFRCRDNSLVYADYYTNNTVRVRQGSQTAEQTTLTAEGGNPPYRADGWSISANADEVTITQPGRGSQSCHS